MDPRRHRRKAERESVASLRYLLMSAAMGAGTGDRILRDDRIDELLIAGHRNGKAALSLTVHSVFIDSVESCWEGGWQPAELVRAVRRKDGSDAADLVSVAILAEQAAAAEDGGRAAPPPLWAAQLDDLRSGVRGITEPDGSAGWFDEWSLSRKLRWPEAVVAAINPLGVLFTVHKVEKLLPPPSQWTGAGWAYGTGHVDEVVLERVRALLAKAESTSFEAEASALTAKAQELMARHSLDEAVAAAASSGPSDGGRPVSRRIAVDDPYASPKSFLLQVIMDANHCQGAYDPTYSFTTVIGFEADVEAVELLFTSLLMQASRAMQAEGRTTDQRGRSRTRSFRQSFLIAFASRIHERLVAAADEARQQVSAELGRDLLPVLHSREREVADAVRAMFPHARSVRGPSATNRDGWQAGRVAGELARLRPERQHLRGSPGLEQ